MITTGKNGRRYSKTTFDEAIGIVDHMKENLTPEERMLVDILGEEEMDNQVLVKEGLFGHIYHTLPVTMEQFIDDPYFLGESCSTIYPAVRDDLIELFDRPYREVIFTGSIGVGKTYGLSIAICRILYELSCMISPQKTFGLSSGSEMVIPLISKNLTLAREVMKSAVDDKIKESPYFMTKFSPNIKKDYTMFPHNIRVTIGSYGSDRILGTNVFSGACDETNFPPKRKGQQISTGFGQKVKAAHFDIVEKIYRGLVRRIKSRFQKAGGGFPGMIILASSAATVESFIERKIRESMDDPMVFVRDHTQWTAKPSEEFCGEFFYVLCSTSATKSRILREDEYDAITDEYMEANDAFVMDIPIEFKEDFESNMEDALRDIAGFSTEAISQFVQRPKMISFCTNTDIKHPFDREEWVAGGPGAINWDALVVEVERRLPGGFKERAFMPRRNPSAMRWCHVDTSTSGDSSGFAIGHVDRWVEVVRRDLEMNAHVDQEPYYIIDFMLRINPPPAEQIYMPDIRVMLYDFMKHGFKFIGFSSDTYQHVEMHQQVSRKGIKPHIISLDTSTEPYDELKSAFYEKRIEVYQYKPFVEEFKKLEYDRLVGKIDHPLAGCFVGSTRIPLLDGSYKMIEEISGESVWIYSCTNDGRIVPGKAKGRMTKYVDELIDVVLDSGAVERCTPEHLWMLRDGSYKEARNLIPGVDRLMPINRQWPINGGYERVVDSHGKRTLTHHMVWESLNRLILDNECIHHINCVKTDNSPENLMVDNKSMHSREHTYKRHQYDPVYKKKVVDGLQKFNLSEHGRRVHGEAIRRTTALRTYDDFRMASEKRLWFRHDIDRESLESVRNENNANAAARALGCGRNVVIRVLKDHGFSSWDEFKKSEIGNNHKVRYIYKVKLDKAVPVYDLEVEKYSNFALSSGVFVHNSKDVSDAVAGVVQGLKRSASMMPLQGRAAKSSVGAHEHSWVTPLIPADKVDIDAVNAAKEGISKEDFMPILFGD